MLKRKNNENKDEIIKSLKDEISHLKQRQKKLEDDIVIYHQIIDHLNSQFEQMKNHILGRNR